SGRGGCMAASYWTRALGGRASRRRVIAMTGAGAASVAFLAACGGGSSGGNKAASNQDKSGLVYTPVDTTKQATRGGTLAHIANADPESFDSLGSGAASVPDATQPIYQRLLRWVVGTSDNRPNAVFEGDAAQSYEITPDGLTLTFKLRANNKWDSRPPTSSRVVTTDDVKFSWDTFAAGAN